MGLGGRWWCSAEPRLFPLFEAVRGRRACAPVVWQGGWIDRGHRHLIRNGGGQEYDVVRDFVGVEMYEILQNGEGFAFSGVDHGGARMIPTSSSEAGAFSGGVRVICASVRRHTNMGQL